MIYHLEKEHLEIFRRGVELKERPQRSLRLFETKTFPIRNSFYSNCLCILLTRSSNFSEVRFSLMLSTFIGKQKGVKRFGYIKIISECWMRSSISRKRNSSICCVNTSWK